MRPRIVVIGSSNTDLVLHCQHLPRSGETVLGGDFARFAGGKGANQAVAAARAGAQVTFIGARGEDDFGSAALAGLRREGVNVRHFSVKPAPSGVALIFIGGKARENLIGVARSANDLLSPADVATAESAFRRANAVVCQLEIPITTVNAAAELAQKHDVPFILNPAPARKLPRGLLKKVSVLTPNEHEVRQLAGEEKIDATAARLLKFGCGAVVVTLGAKGALVCEGTATTAIRVPKVRPLDTVGAGDCFTAWLAWGVAQGHSLVAAAERAARAASVAVTRKGAQAGMPFADEVP
jgi:ribokinase